MTEYRNINGFPDYRIGDDGTVWSWKCQAGTKKKRWKQLKPWSVKGDYQIIGLKNEGERVCRSIHNLVLEHFIGPKPEGMEGCHNDSNPTNNVLGNLRWDTPKHNCDDRTEHGLHMEKTGRGSTHAMHKLVEDEVLEIRESNLDSIDLAELYNVSYRTIRDIITRKTWRHI